MSEHRTIAAGTTESRTLVEDIRRAQLLVERLNTISVGDAEALREAFAELTDRPVPAGLRLVPPFHTDYGRALRVGRDVFVNHGCTINDIGGVELGDGVMLGPNVQLLSSGHPTDPVTRRSAITAASIRVGPGAWVGAGATVLQGVTIGADAVVGAGAVVTHDVPARTLVAGVPASGVKHVLTSPTPPYLFTRYSISVAHSS